MLHFKRFQFDGETRKISHEISGSTTLRVGSESYALCGVLVHESLSATSGHYYCDVVCSPHEETALAYKCNDALCSSLRGEALDSDFKVAYMHIYELVTGKEDTPVAKTAGSDIDNGWATRTAATAAENQQKTSGLQADVDVRRKLKAWVEEAERIRPIAPARRSKEEKRAFRWLEKTIKKVIENNPDAEELVLSAAKAEQRGGRLLQATSDEQQRSGRLQATVEEQGHPAGEELKEKYPDMDTESHCKAETGAEIIGADMKGRCEAKKHFEREKGRSDREGEGESGWLAGGFGVNTDNLSAMDKVS